MGSPALAAGPDRLPRRVRADGPRRSGSPASLAAAVDRLPVFRPLAAPRDLPEPTSRAAADLVRAYGSDTLAFFKLRRTSTTYSATTGAPSSATGSRTACSLVSGDPVGPPSDSGPAQAARRVRREPRPATRRRRRSEELRALCRAARAARAVPGRRGDRRHGDLHRSRAARSGRSASRSPASRRRATAPSCASWARSTRHVRALERGLGAWRAGARAGLLDGARRAPGRPRGRHFVVLARDARGDVRGFLHFVPSYGRPAMSLSFMRRDERRPTG